MRSFSNPSFLSFIFLLSLVVAAPAFAEDELITAQEALEYLETTNPDLYGQLDPNEALLEVSHLISELNIESLSHFGQLFRSGKTFIGVAVSNQPVSIFLIYFRPLGLNIGCVGTANIRAFIPFNAEPAQSGHHIFGSAGNGAFCVRVFNSKDKLTMMATGV